MKKLVLSLAFVLVSSFAIGQVLTKEQIKEQKKQKKALMNMVIDAEAKISVDPIGVANAIKPAIANPLVNTDPYVWFVSVSAKNGVINNENRKRAEGANFNESMLYTYVYELGKDIATLEKYDNAPDEKGRVKPKHTEFITTTLATQFTQFFNAGAFYYNASEFEKAYDLFGMFNDASDKLYKANIIGKDTTNVPLASYYRSLCGMQLKDYDKVLANVDGAMQHPDYAKDAFRFKADAVNQKGDTIAWLDICKEGLTKFPDDIYYSQSLIYYYDSNNKSEELDKLADNLIASDPSNPLFVYLKGYIAGQKEDYDTAIKWYEKTLEVDPNYKNALSNISSCYMRKAQKYNQEQSSTNINNKRKTAEDNKILDGFFRSALPYLEKLREIASEEHDLWLVNLTNCYYNLNMESQYKELMKLQESLYGEME